MYSEHEIFLVLAWNNEQLNVPTEKKRNSVTGFVVSVAIL